MLRHSADVDTKRGHGLEMLRMEVLAQRRSKKRLRMGGSFLCLGLDFFLRVFRFNAIDNIRGREVDGGPAHRKPKSGIGQRRRDAVARFLHRRIRQPDDDDRSVALTRIDLHVYGEGFDSIDRSV